MLGKGKNDKDTGNERGLMMVLREVLSDVDAGKG